MSYYEFYWKSAKERRRIALFKAGGADSVAAHILENIIHGTKLGEKYLYEFSHGIKIGCCKRVNIDHSRKQDQDTLVKYFSEIDVLDFLILLEESHIHRDDTSSKKYRIRELIIHDAIDLM